jgi:Uma2 family endonuclease
LSPVYLGHDRKTNYLRQLFEAYFSFRPIGQIVAAPFVMRLSNIDSRREPDLQVILNEHLDRIKPTYTDGPADICIEVVSPSNASTDYGEKLVEYEAGGVREYWMFDQERQIAYFYRLHDQGVYTNIPLDKQGEYQTPLLPGFRLTIATLWQEKLPTLLEVIEQVRASLNLTDDAQGTS